MSQLVSRPQGTAIVATTEARPLLTAILVTRNKESHLRECLVGLMEQSVADRMEVIVVDDGSEQSEWAAVADLQRRHRNLICLRTATPAGDCAAWNLALKIASGKYLTILEATDRFKQDAYELLAAELERRPDAVLAYGDTCLTAIPHEGFANHTSYGKMIWPDYTEQLLAQLSQVAPHPVWRRELHDSIGCFSEDHPGQEMRDFLLRAVERFGLVHVHEFTGLKLIATGAPMNREVRKPEAPPLAARSSEPASAPAPATSTAAATAPEPIRVGADEAYAAIQSLANGDELPQAAAALEKHLMSYPEHAIAQNDLAAVCYRMGEKEKALLHYRAAVRLAPQERDYQKNLADMLYVESGEVDEAIGIYLELLKSSPRDTETLLSLGIISEGVGQPSEAESFYQRALEIEPWNPGARERLSDLRLRASEASSVEDDEPAEERYERAQQLVAQGDLEGAARKLEQLLGDFPDFSPAHNDLAVIYYQNGAKDQALMHYEKAAALVPGNNTFQKNLADFYFVEGRDVDGAIAIYLEQLRREPGNVETLMSLGKICTVLDRPLEAESFYGKVTELEPWNQSARECLSTLRRCANG
jgi:Flp pilus assembly protein TadD